MTGWRVGYIVANKMLIDNVTKLNQITFNNVPLFIQDAALKGLELHAKIASSIKAKYKERADLATKKLSAGGFKFTKPDAPFYVFPKRDGLDGEKFTLSLLDKGVAVAPGTSFGDYREHFRISLTAPRRPNRKGLRENLRGIKLMRTAVLGAGKMGVWFAKWCKRKATPLFSLTGNPQKLAKLKEELGVETADFPTAVQGADRVLICVSISSFEEIVKKIAPAVIKGQPVMDISSIKEYPVNIMHKYLKDALVLGTHPVFRSRQHGVRTQSLRSYPNQSRGRSLRQRISSGGSKKKKPTYSS